MQRTRGRPRVPALSLDPSRLADLALRTVQGPASPETSRLLLSNHIDGRTLSAYIDDVESIISAVSDEGLRGEVNDALHQVSGRILPPPRISRSASSILSLTEVAERLMQRQEPSEANPRPHPPPAADETIPEWDFDDTPFETYPGATSSDLGVMQPETPQSPASTYFSLDLYSENLLGSPASMRDALSEARSSDHEETPIASPLAHNEGLRSDVPAEINRDTDPSREDLESLLRVTDRILLASSIAMLQHIARLDAMAVQSATPSHVGHSCHCAHHACRASTIEDAGSEPHPQMQVPFATQEVYDRRPEPQPSQDAAKPPVEPISVCHLTASEIIAGPEAQEAQPLIPSEIQQTPEASGAQVDPTTQPSPQRDFVRILHPSVHITRPRYRDVEVQVGDGEVVTAEPEDGQARYPSFVLL